MSTKFPLACTPATIPDAERHAHFALARRLFGGVAVSWADVQDGREYRFPAESLPEVARFVENERKCCPFLAFTLAVEARGEGIRLRMTGPDGTVDFLNAELPTQ